jgi:hypothetical protein
VQSHSFRWGYSWTKTYLQNRGYLQKAPRRGAHRRKRARKPLPGMMLHQDGSRHGWIPAFDRALDLIITLDDATTRSTRPFWWRKRGRSRASAAWRKYSPSGGFH